MKTAFIFCCVACMFACSKPSVDNPAPIDSVVTVPKTPAGIGYDSLRILLQEGMVLQYQRYDALFLRGWSAMDSTKILTALHWQNKRGVFDSFKVYRVYRDTSLETITIGSRITFNELPVKYSKAYLLYMDSALTDTSKITVWWIRNHTWNRTDTAYVYLSQKTLWMFSQTPYGTLSQQPPNIKLSLPLAKNFTDYPYRNKLYSKADTGFSVNNTVYFPGLYISAYSANCFGSCMVFTSTGDDIYLSSRYGLVRHTSTVEHNGYTTDGNIIQVERRLLP